MIEIDLTSDVEAAIREVGAFFQRQLPFAVSQALNDTAFAVRTKVVTETYPAAFTVRNQAFPGKLWRVAKFARKDALEATVEQQAVGSRFHEYMGLQTTGGTKVAQRAHIAIPSSNITRTTTGRVPKPKKPRNLPNTFVRTGKGGNLLIMQSVRKQARLMYVMQPTAPIEKRFRFYEDAEIEAVREFPLKLSLRMSTIVANSRFFPG